MRRQLLLISLVFGLSSAVQAQSGVSPEAPSRSPAWLPRGAFLGTYIRAGAVTPQARVQWQLTLFQDRKDALVLVLEGGGGYGAVLPDTAVEGFEVPVDAFHEHTVMLGGGYRNQSPSGFHWGFQVTGGPLWYGAHFRNLPDERFTAGLVEGRVHLGHQLGPTVLGVSLGYGEPFSFRRSSVSRKYLGGVLLGFFADWR
jgi:opacity protein-like surface antigen